MKKGLLLLIVLFCLTGCNKNYSELTSTKFLSEFTGKDYTIIDHSYETENFFDKNIEVGKKNVNFYYVIYKTEKEAKEFMEEKYKNNKKYKYVQKGKTIIATDQGIKEYTKVIKVNKTILVAKSNGLFAKLKLKQELNNLGY